MSIRRAYFAPSNWIRPVGFNGSSKANIVQSAVQPAIFPRGDGDRLTYNIIQQDFHIEELMCSGAKLSLDLGTVIEMS